VIDAIPAAARSTEDRRRPGRMDVWINWGFIAEMYGWMGTIEDLKKVRVEELPRLRREAMTRRGPYR
jgi:hypothetical protein